MGNNLFGANISGQIAQALGSKLLSATLVKVVATARTGGNPASGLNPTRTSYACKGFIDSYSNFDRSLELIKDSDHKITILGDTIASGKIPEPNDEIIIEGQTYSIVNVTRDPDAATYTIQGRA